MMGLPGPSAFIAHDAGAANHILAWLSEAPDEAPRAYMAGPAAALWARAFPSRPCAGSIAEAIAGARSVVTGSGWASAVEHEGRKSARAAGLPCAAVIDHWTNYRARFTCGDETVLPDVVWVTDRWAMELARDAFPGLPVVEQPNRYVAQEVERIAALPQGNDILYLGEPARDDWGRGEPGEFQALRGFMEARAELGLDKVVPVRLRPHPSEPAGKYRDLLTQWPGATLDFEPDLSRAIAKARWVAGMQSFAMTIALAAGRKTISTLPSWAPRCALPHTGIIHLSDRLAS